MIYGFIKQSDGHVAIYSEPNLGTTVRMYLPAASTRKSTPLRQPRIENTALPGGAETVLVVEDDPFVRAYAVMCMKSLGYNATAAVDGNDALQKLERATRFDILFTDVVMPGGVDGWELADRARRIQPDLRVLMTSGYAPETLARRGPLRSRVAVLAKPYRKADLARRLREIINETA